MFVPGPSVDFWSRSRSFDDSHPMLPEGMVRGWAVQAVGRAAVALLSCRSECLQYGPLVFQVPARGSYTEGLLCSSWDSCQVPFQPSREQSKGQFASRLLVTTKRTRLDLQYFKKLKVRTRTKWSTTRNRGLVFSRAIAAGEASTRVLEQAARKRKRCRHVCATTWKGLLGAGSRMRTVSIA